MSPPFGEKRSGALSMAGGTPVFFASWSWGEEERDPWRAGCLACSDKQMSIIDRLG